MKPFKIIFIFFLCCTIIISCKKEDKSAINNKTKSWQFTKLVNATLDNDGYMISLDFYQKKDNQWRILQFEPDDYTKYNFKDSITPNNSELPIDNENAFLTCNAFLFNPATNLIHFPYRMKWTLGSPVLFNSTKTFSTDFPDIPTTKNTISNFSAATYSFEQAYDNNSKTNTYIFYDFPNQKYLYYAEKSGTDLILENTLPLLCSTCNLIPWKSIDAVTCTNQKDNPHNYFFFDFDAQKMYLLTRENINTNHPSFTFDKGLVIDFKDAFKKEWTSLDREQPFDFSI